MDILGFIIFLIVAAICAGIGEALVPNMVPGGFFTSAVVGIIGAWIGSALFGHAGPILGGIAVLPAIIGSAIFVFCISLLSKFTHRSA